MRLVIVSRGANSIRSEHKAIRCVLQDGSHLNGLSEETTLETAIWIALISALGVILSALIQWRSNKATLKAAEERELAEREERGKQIVADREHQRILAAEAGERALALNEREAAKALADTWRPKRVEAHEKALRAIDECRRTMDAEKFHFFMSRIRKVPLQKSNSSFGGIVKEIDLAGTDVHMFGSENASKHFQSVRDTLSSLQGAFMTKRLLTAEEAVSDDEMKRIDIFFGALDTNIAEYRKAAKTDIGTQS